jgi:dihydrofolate synthase/folylpolyglutamate synthase
MLTTKDHLAFLKNFSGLAHCIIGVPIPRQPKSLPASAIADAARALDVSGRTASDIENALALAGRLGLEPPPRIMITGSLYLAGEVLAINETPPN